MPKLSGYPPPLRQGAGKHTRRGGGDRAWAAAGAGGGAPGRAGAPAVARCEDEYKKIGGQPATLHSLGPGFISVRHPVPFWLVTEICYTAFCSLVL